MMIIGTFHLNGNLTHMILKFNIGTLLVALLTNSVFYCLQNGMLFMKNDKIVKEKIGKKCFFLTGLKLLPVTACILAMEVDAS